MPGRLYPITIEYLPPEVKEGDKKPPLPSESRQTVSGLTTTRGPGSKPKPIDTTPYLRLLERIDREYSRSERGDLLVFLSGINEISAVAERLREHVRKTKRWIVLLLHSSVPAEEQDKVPTTLETDPCPKPTLIPIIVMARRSDQAKVLFWDRLRSCALV